MKPLTDKKKPLSLLFGKKGGCHVIHDSRLPNLAEFPFFLLWRRSIAARYAKPTVATLPFFSSSFAARISGRSKRTRVRWRFPFFLAVAHPTNSHSYATSGASRKGILQSLRSGRRRGEKILFISPPFRPFLDLLSSDKAFFMAALRG